MLTRRLRERAQRGDAEASYTLAAHLATGFHTKKNSREAIKWYRLAAVQKHCEAEWNLGWMLLRGEGVRRNTKAGIRWIRLAARHGSKDATRFLASIQKMRRSPTRKTSGVITGRAKRDKKAK